MVRFLCIGLVVCLVSGVIYIFPSGQPQPADYLMVLWAASVLLLLGARFARSFRPLVVLLCFGVLWACIVNWTWVIIGYPEMAVRPLYYVFNAVVVLAIWRLATVAPVQTAEYILLGIALATLLVVAFALLAPGASYRATGPFNNPNQLGYFGVMCASAGGVGIHVRGWSSRAACALIGGIASSVLSMSLAAIAAVCVLMVVMSYHQLAAGYGGRANAALWYAVIGAMIVAVFVVAQQVLDAHILLALDSRLDQVPAKIANPVAQRGYDRFMEYPHMIIAGAGEGAWYRFTAIIDRELHSTWGTVAFSYGIPGMVIAFASLLQIRRITRGGTIVYFLPAALYGTTHMGLRFAYLWIVLALAVASSSHGFMRDGVRSARLNNAYTSRMAVSELTSGT